MKHSGERLVHVVDDEEPVRRSTALMLRMSGWKVSTFEHGAAFLEAVDAIADGCILLDVRMPVLDGLQVQRHLIGRGVDLPLIVMTGHGDIAVATTALREGAVAYIEKPFSKERLLSALELGFMKLQDPEAYASSKRDAARALAALSVVERNVIQQLSLGHSNQTVSQILGIPLGEVERCRATAAEKTGSAALSDVISLTIAAEAARRN
jgi:two-component system response regulator FixJ